MSKTAAPDRDKPERDKLADQAASYVSTMQQLQRNILRQLGPSLTEQYGIDFRLYAIIRQIDSGAVHPGAISKILYLPNSVITRHLDQIVDKGMVERSLDSEDSRKIRLTLTKEGQRVAREAHRTICGLVGARLKSLPPAKREAFLAALATLAADDA